MDSETLVLVPAKKKYTKELKTDTKWPRNVLK